MTTVSTHREQRKFFPSKCNVLVVRRIRYDVVVRVGSTKLDLFLRNETESFYSTHLLHIHYGVSKISGNSWENTYFCAIFL